MYADGTNIGHKSGWGPEVMSSFLRACVLSVIAVNAGDRIGDNNPAGIILSAGDDVITDTSWKCNSQEEEGWMLYWFNDEHWEAATSLGANGVGPWGTLNAISANAHWIWSTTYWNPAYCRKVVC